MRCGQIVSRGDRCFPSIVPHETIEWTGELRVAVEFTA
jgi:hypothetical protein